MLSMQQSQDNRQIQIAKNKPRSALETRRLRRLRRREREVRRSRPKATPHNRGPCIKLRSRNRRLTAPSSYPRRPRRQKPPGQRVLRFWQQSANKTRPGSPGGVACCAWLSFQKPRPIIVCLLPSTLCLIFARFLFTCLFLPDAAIC